MVYVDETGEKYELQYCVVLIRGKDKDLRNYVWASEKQIKNAIAEIKNRSPYVDGEELCCKNEKYEVRFNPSRLGSLVIKTENMESAKNIFLGLYEKI